jgi:hypothetical protein
VVGLQHEQDALALRTALAERLGNLHAGFCPGGGPKGPSLPEQPQPPEAARRVRGPRSQTAQVVHPRRKAHARQARSAPPRARRGRCSARRQIVVFNRASASLRGAAL